MSQKTTSSLLHCESCGEDYSSTYRRCPFCGSKGGKPKTPVSVEDEYVFDGGYIFDEIDRESSEKAPREHQNAGSSRSGKRQSGNSGASVASTASSHERSRSRVPNSASPASEKKQGHPDVRTAGARSRTSHSWIDRFDELLERYDLTLPRLIGLVFSLAVIIAAFIILITVIIPMFGNDSGDDSKVSNSGTSQTGNPTPSGTGTTSPVPTTPATSPTPTTSGSDIPAGQTATDFTLSLQEFAISDRWPQPVTIKVTLIPANSKGSITWTSSNEAVATVDQNGTVTAVSKGSATITATLTGGASHSCKVYVNISENAATPAPSPSASQEPSASPSPSVSPEPSPEPSPSASASPEPSTPVENPITLSKKEFTISEQWPQPVTLKVSNAVGDVVWSTSDATVAIVDSSGKVTGMGRGRCTITATDAAGNKAECIVRCTIS